MHFADKKLTEAINAQRYLKLLFRIAARPITHSSLRGILRKTSSCALSLQYPAISRILGRKLLTRYKERQPSSWKMDLVFARLRNDGIILFIRSPLRLSKGWIVIRRAIYGLEVHASYNFQRVETRTILYLTPLLRKNRKARLPSRWNPTFSLVGKNHIILVTHK